MPQIKCFNCENFILNEDKAVKCSLFCGKYFHKLCLNLSDEVLNCIIKTNSNVSYRCIHCVNSPVMGLLAKVNELLPVVEVLCKKVDALDLNLKDIKNSVALSKEKEIVVAKNINSDSDMHNFSVNNVVTADVVAAAVVAGHGSSDVPPAAAAVSTVISINENKKCNKKKIEKCSTNASICEFGAPSVVIDKNKQLLSSANMISADDGNSLSSAVVVGSSRMNQMVNKSNRIHVVGMDSNDDISDDIAVLNPLFWLHISKFKSSTSEDSIKKYVASKLDCNEGVIKCFKLVKRNVSLDDLSYVSFKIGLPIDLYDFVLNPLNWPRNVLVKKFNNFSKNAKVRNVLKKTPILDQAILQS